MFAVVELLFMPTPQVTGDCKELNSIVRPAVRLKIKYKILLLIGNAAYEPKRALTVCCTKAEHTRKQ